MHVRPGTQKCRLQSHRKELQVHQLPCRSPAICGTLASIAGYLLAAFRAMPLHRVTVLSALPEFFTNTTTEDQEGSSSEGRAAFYCFFCIHIPKTVEKKNSWIFERDKHAILQQLTCPLCKQMYQNSYILPCEHCLCQCCVDKIKTRDKCSRDNYLIMTCPSCNTAHYFSSKEPIRLPENYLRAKVAQKYGAQYGAPRIAILCEQCLPHKKTEAALRCIVCKINYCQKCHSFSHKSKSFQGHTLTQNFWEGEEKKNCFHHPLTPIIEYCMTDRTLICKQCKCAYHEDHYSLPLTEACTEEAHALFAAIAKFKQVRCRLVNDLMEINLVNTNFKGYKETTKKEICNGFLKLHEILHEQERSVLGSVETIEFRKQQNITQFIDVSDKMLQSIEGIIQYSKEALKEENPVTFLQSANTLVKEIDKEVLQIYQPDSSLKEDPIKNLRLNFDEIASSLCLLFPKPTIGISHLESSQKYPYITDTGENIHVPRFTESRCLVTSRSTESLFPYELRASNFLRGEDTYGRPKSTPPISYKNNSMGEFLEEYPIRSSGNVNTGYTSHNFIAPSSSQQSMVPREPPSPVSIYKTIIYPNAAEGSLSFPLLGHEGPILMTSALQGSSSGSELKQLLDSSIVTSETYMNSLLLFAPVSTCP
ncbi:tripartite motif-containing protein 42 [Ascaphus truei]|uniref:tripartite motif-containing protein 42 n=1 Tax=Ascaphus truei TaxID=8439 RepID=UPI003F59E9D7